MGFARPAHEQSARDEPLKNYTSFRVGGPADLLSMPEDKDELLSIIKQASVLNIPITLIGGGTNVLITDKGIRGLLQTIREVTPGDDTGQVEHHRRQTVGGNFRYLAKNHSKDQCGQNRL